MPKETGRKVVANNKKARHEYLIEDTVEAGLVLTGTEVKSLRQGRASLVDGYATSYGGELYLEGVHIPEYTQGTWTNHSARRRRKLLRRRLCHRRRRHCGWCCRRDEGRDQTRCRGSRRPLRRSRWTTWTCRNS